LRWRSIGTVGNNSIWLHENDTGPDDANHAEEGIIISSNAELLPRKIYDIREAIISYFEQ